MKVFFRLSIPILLLTLCVASAAEYKKLSGSYAITSSNIVDPGPGEKKDRLVLYLEGDAARDTYENLAATVKPSACDPDLMTKELGGISCSKDISRNDVQCTIGLLLKSGASIKTSAC